MRTLMRRTRLNIVPPATKEVALAQSRDLETVTVIGQSSIVDEGDMPARETRTQRVRRLQDEARALAREQIAEFEFLIDATSKMAQEISEGGDVYPVGAREICRRLAEELPRTLQTLQIVTRKGQ